MKSKEILDFLPNGSAIGQMFDMMKVVEDEIARMIELHPLHSDILDNCFIMFAEEEERQPFYELMSMFKYHVRELLERAVDLPSRKELRCLGTDAQAIVAFYYLTLKTPVTSDAGLAYFRLVQRTIMTDEDEIAEALTEGFEMWIATSFEGAYESYDGAVDEHIVEAKRKMSFDGRKFPQEVNNDLVARELFDQGAKGDDRISQDRDKSDIRQLGLFASGGS
jgi:hypothetical protein